MKLVKYRKLNYTEQILNINHPFVQYKKINFKGIDNSKIELDLVIPSSDIKGIIIDFPEYKIKNKDYLTLTKYSLLDYALISLHIRGQAGNSENNTTCSHFPFLDCNNEIPYYNLVFQDALDTLQIIESLFPNKDIYVTGVGQGAAISIICAKFYDTIKELFISDCSLCDIKNTYIQNKNNPIFKKLYNFEMDLPEKTDYLYNVLDSIDILNISNSIGQKVHYALSYLSPKTPHSAQLKLIDSLNDIEVQHYKFLNYKKIFQHQFDDYILETLSNR